MKIIQNATFPNERDLYAATDVKLVNCSFEGIEDGESALKEARNVEIDGCIFKLKYPLWHDTGVKMRNSLLTESCRAALWYTEDVSIVKSQLLGIKAVRECSRVDISSSSVVSPEFGWKSRFVTLSDCDVASEYLFLMASNVNLSNVKFDGKYSFQYAKDVTVENSVLNTKDAFWHAQNVTVKNSVVKGEYLGWYSRKLTFVNCTIIGTQPLCYCQELTLIDCKMQQTDLAFEYSDVQATISGSVLSVKNPRSGSIVADSFGEVIFTSDSKYPCNCAVTARNRAN